MSSASLGTLLRTLRHYRGAQLWHQALHVVPGTAVRPQPRPAVPPELASDAAAVPFLGAPAHARPGEGSLELLNRKVAFGPGFNAEMLLLEWRGE